MVDPLHFRMKVTPSGIGSKIFVEGRELENVRKITVVTDTELSRVYVEFINVEVEIEGEAEVTNNLEEDDG